MSWASAIILTILLPLIVLGIAVQRPPQWYRRLNRIERGRAAQRSQP